MAGMLPFDPEEDFAVPVRSWINRNVWEPGSRQLAEQKAREAALERAERARREHDAILARAARERLMAILRGERPTRESMADYAARRGMLPLPMPPAVKEP